MESINRIKRCPPKAEVTGSNPVGRANDFNSLEDISLSVLNLGDR